MRSSRDSPATEAGDRDCADGIADRLADLRRRLADARQGRGRVQRGCRLRVPRQGRHRRARKRQCPLRHGSVAFFGPRRAFRREGPRRRMVASSPRGGDQRAREPGLSGKRRHRGARTARGRCSTRSAPLASSEDATGRARRQSRRSRGPPARSTGGRRSAAPCSRSSNPDSPRTRCARLRRSSACGHGTSRLRPAWPRGFHTELLSPAPTLRAVAIAESGLRALGFRADARASLRRVGPHRARLGRAP